MIEKKQFKKLNEYLGKKFGENTVAAVAINSGTDEGSIAFSILKQDGVDVPKEQLGGLLIAMVHGAKKVLTSITGSEEFAIAIIETAIKDKEIDKHAVVSEDSMTDVNDLN